MSLSASLNAGVQGLAVNSTRLSAISDNIVNANTNGYKRTLTEFSSVVIDGANETRYTAGGVRSFVKREITAIGTLESTNNATDIAISGQGFFAITPSQDPSNFNPFAESVYLTSTGSFQEDAEGFLRNSGDEFLLGWPLNPDGTTINTQPSRNSYTDLEPVNARVVRFNAVETSIIRLSGPIPAAQTSVGASGETIVHNEEYFDTIGNTNTLTYSFTPDVPTTGNATNRWTLEVTDSASADPLVGSFTVLFNSATEDNSGTIQSITPNLIDDTDGDTIPDASRGSYDPSTGEITIGTSSTDIRTFVGFPGLSSGITQTGSLDQSALRLDFKDGSGFGEYKGVQIDSDGIVRAFFTNDQSRPIYQVPVVTVTNPNQMEPIGNQAYLITPDAGSFALTNSGDQSSGKISGYALIKSSVDVAQELTHLIETQRAYSTSAKVIQTVDEMLQETTNLKR